jgi:cell division septation protein DedD
VTPRLEQHIKKVLYNKRVFDIPGIGSFHLKREAAKFSEDKTTIYPPSFHVEFSDQFSNIPTDESYKDEIHQLSERIINEVAVNGKSKIRNLGVFQKESEKFNFYPDKELEKAFSGGLEPIYNVKEVSKSYSGTPTKVAETLVVAKPKKDYSALIKNAKILGYILLGLGLLYALLNIPITLKDNNTPVIKEIKTTKPSDVITKIDTIAKVDTPLTQSIVDHTPSATPEAHDNDQSTTPTNEADAPKKEVVIPAKEIAKVSTPKTIATPKNKAPKSSAKATSKPQPISLAKPKLDSNEISKVTGKACAVITGSFKTSVYAMKMVKKLQKLGYKVYTEEKGSMTRVGLLYDCTKMNADSLLKDVRSKVDTTSWILE